MRRIYSQLILLLMSFCATSVCFGELTYQGQLRQSVHSKEMAAAILRQRTITRSVPSLDQLSTFKGFTYEQNLLRRLQQSAPSEVSYGFASTNDEIADLIRVDASGRRFGVQVYGGATLRSAFEKLIASDAAAHELIVAKDVHRQMKVKLLAAEEVFRQHIEGNIKEIDARRLISKRLKGTGLTLSPDDFDLGLNANGSRYRLGLLGSGDTARVLSKVTPDSKTSAQIYRDSLKGLLDPTSDSALGRLAKNLHLDSDAGVSGIQRLFDERIQIYKRQELTYPRAAQKADNWLRTTKVPELNRAIEYEQRRARALGVTHEQLAEIQKRPRVQNISQRASHYSADLRRETRKIAVKQQLTGNSVAAVFHLVGAGADLYFSGASFSEWLLSPSAKQWAARGAMTSVIVSSSIALERQLIAKGVEHSNKSATNTLVQDICRSGAKRKIVVGGFAGAMFIAGESLIEIIAYGRSFEEVSGYLYESIAVMVVSEAAVFGVTSLLFSAETASPGGPYIVATAVAVAATYEGAKYLWTYERELTTSTQILQIRCNYAQKASQESFKKLAVPDTALGNGENQSDAVN